MLIPGFSTPTHFSQFFSIRTIWQYHGTVAQCTFYYGYVDVIPLLDTPTWAGTVAQAFIEHVWRVNPVLPTKPALSRVVHEHVQLSELRIRSYDSNFDMVTVTEVNYPVAENGLRSLMSTGSIEHVEAVLNVQYELAPAALISVESPKRGYVALPPLGRDDYSNQGWITSTALSTIRDQVKVLGDPLPVGGTPLFPFGDLFPVRVRAKKLPASLGGVIAYGYAGVRGAFPRPRMGIRRSRRGE